MSEVALADCEVPAEKILGKEGSWSGDLHRSMEWERTCIMASHSELMQRLLETSVKYAESASSLAQPIGKFSAVANTIADMDVRLEAGRLLLYKAAWLKNQGRHPLREAAIAKLYVSEAVCAELPRRDSDPWRLRIHDASIRSSANCATPFPARFIPGHPRFRRVIISGFHGL